MNGRNVVAWFVMATVGGLVGVWWQWGDFDALRDQRRLWSEGVPARLEAIEVDEDRTSGEGRAFFFRSYRYGVRATYEIDGGLVQSEASFATLLRSIDQSQTPEVRVDPSAPERFVTSWGHDRVGASALFLAWKWCVTALWVTVMLFGALTELRPGVGKRLEQLAGQGAAAEAGVEQSRVTTGQGTRELPLAAALLGFAALLLVVGAVLSLVGMFLEDVVRRFGSYLEDALGLLVGLGLLALVGSAFDLLRRVGLRAWGLRRAARADHTRSRRSA